MFSVIKANDIHRSSLINSIMQYRTTNPDIPALKWGREHESVARNDYVAKVHRNFETALSGLVIDPTLPYLPDGISSCDCCGTRLLEIKCPYKYKDVSPVCNVALSDSKFFLQKDVKGTVALSKKHNYYTQVQGQLLITHQKCCDFVCWTNAECLSKPFMLMKNFKRN